MASELVNPRALFGLLSQFLERPRRPPVDVAVAAAIQLSAVLHRRRQKAVPLCMASELVNPRALFRLLSQFLERPPRPPVDVAVATAIQLSAVLHRRRLAAQLVACLHLPASMCSALLRLEERTGVLSTSKGLLGTVRQWARAGLGMPKISSAPRLDALR